MPRTRPLLPHIQIPGIAVLSVSAWVDGGIVRAKGMPAPGSTVSYCVTQDLIDPAGSTAYSGFQLTTTERDHHNDRILFIFNQAIGGKTLIRSVHTTDPSVYWPDVITSFAVQHAEFLPDGSVSVGGALCEYSRVAVVCKRIASYRGLTRITIDDYISSSSISSDATESLHPSTVEWDLLNDQRTLPESLHGSIVIPQVLKYGTNVVIVPQRTFAATPQTDWIDHVRFDDVKFSDGFWFQRVITAQVPPHNPGES